ncbi:CubicO group peptidase (beta-lactamase class C family) [Neolewinella xylanilytica]|uniref:CubicO group peptidase (Beta-lactamase class C family) n=1 Tax=Neolewinella xylanilytica TaxID=1514080 RepID=A0A2S6I9M4_9BACT|nr:CubicO group peptidase (beta-lactamase class C family) [Neolewinella xylanilytica]
MRFILLLCWSLLPLLGSVRAQDLYFPPVVGNEWEQLDPGTLDYDPERIEALYGFLDRTNTKAFVLLYKGRIVLDHYMNGFGADSLHYWASAGKTLLSAAVGIAAEEGHLELDAASSTYLGTGWTQCSPGAEADITVLDHLRMTTGLDDTGDFFCTDAACLTCLAEPGTRWAYYNAPFTKLHDVLAAATGQTPTQFIRQRFRATTGIAGGYVSLGPYNEVFLSTPRVMARFGLLLLNRGAWAGEQIIPAAYHARMTTPSQSINASYGLLTWLNGQSTHMLNGSREVYTGPLLPAAPADTYFAAGKNGQFINVAPSQQLVWVRVGGSPTEAEDYVATVYNDEIWGYVNRLRKSTSTALGLQRQAPRLAVAPNPAVHEVRLTAEEPPSSVVIYDATGRRVSFLEPKLATVSVSVRELPAGPYRLVCFWADGRRADRTLSVVH